MDEKTKHTPGPWKHRNGHIFCADREEVSIAKVARTYDGDYSPDNGSLLAAAPELLEALEGLLATMPGEFDCAFFHHPRKDEHGFDEPCPAVARAIAAREDARAAIAKAKGGEG